MVKKKYILLLKLHTSLQKTIEILKNLDIYNKHENTKFIFKNSSTIKKLF